VSGLPLAQAVVQEFEVEEHKHVLQGARETGDELPRDVGRGKLEHVLNRRMDLLEVLIHDPTQASCILLESLGNQSRVKEQMDAALSAIEQPLRLHADLPHPTRVPRDPTGLLLLIGWRGQEIESGHLHESCR